MPQYEIALIIDPTLNQEGIKKEIENLLSLFSSEKDYLYDIEENQPLAYLIKKFSTGHRITLNFETEDAQKIREFNRLVVSNKSVLRSLVINKEKSYGYRASKNADKLESSQIRKKRYEAYLEKKTSLQSLKKNISNVA